MRFFTTPPIENVTFGEGALEALPERLGSIGGTRALVVMSASLARGSVGERVQTVLGGAGIGTFAETPQHVPREAVLAAARMARECGADSVISVGGGTSIDCAKGVAMCLSQGLTELSQFDAYRALRTTDGEVILPKELESAIPHVSIPTTLSGAEHTDIVGISDTRTHAKHVFRFRALAPRAVILDPHVAAYTPPQLWAASGIRALDHAVESILANGSIPFVDALATKAIRMLDDHLAHSTFHPDDAAARSACLEAAWLAIFGITNTGAGLSHAIGHQLATRFNLLHGVSSAIMLPTVMEFNAPVTREKLALIAAAFGCTDDGYASSAPELVRQFVDRLPVPNRISTAGGNRSHFAEMASEIAGDISLASNPRPVTESSIVTLLEAAW
ncbi:iron-containing alcohol dehydrogenase [Rhodococcus qingshengii]|uniref:iron-containing alcohol dehydrogenase n=1 Tax=Rhodococcus qingshengii TaxID=334542 RepID=UPI0035DE21EC